MKTQAELLLECRQWMQSALEALTLCPSAHTSPSLRVGDDLLSEIDATMRGSLRAVPMPPPTTRVTLAVYGVMSLPDLHGEPRLPEFLPPGLPPEGRLPAIERKMHEVESALVVVGTALSSLDALVRAAKAIEGSKK